MHTTEQMTDIHECHIMTALMLTQAEEKRRKAELRKANKAAAKATGASPSGVIGSAAAGVPLPLPLPQGARGNGVGALASSPPVPVAGVPGDLSTCTTAMQSIGSHHSAAQRRVCAACLKFSCKHMALLLVHPSTA